VRALLIATHPVQYAVPQYRQFAADPRVDATVAFLSMHGMGDEVDPEFGIPVTWDVPLLDGYRWIHPRNRSPRPGIRGFFGLINPGLWREIRRGTYDVVVCFGYRTASFWIAAIAAKFTRTPLAWTTDAHTLGIREGRTWKPAAKRVALPLIFKLGDAVFAPSSRTAAFLESLGVPRGRIHLTPYVVDNGFFSTRSSSADASALRGVWGIPDGDVVALFVGKLVAWKRPADLLRAVGMIPRAFGVFVGEGPLRSDLEVLAADLGVTERVRFLGFRNQTELPAIYTAADVLVLPSEYEPFGLVVNEAFACGTPAIVSDACGSAGDLIVAGETGWTFPASDVEALAERLASLVRDADLRANLARGARSRIAGWGPEVWLESVVEALRSTASRHRGHVG
jgi:glycosyltransferase involved in cell wall biosynthesis